MLLNSIEYNKNDAEAFKILDDFLPDKIIDAHSHLFDTDFLPKSHSSDIHVVADVQSYINAMNPILGYPNKLRLNVIPFPEPTMKDLNSRNLYKSDTYVKTLIDSNPENVYEIIVLPTDKCEDIENRLFSKRIKGLKCYYSLSSKPNVAQLPIWDYLPESAWEVAKKHKLCITLHMMKSEALAHPDNLSYIKTMSKKYPEVILILAHCARAFASWTGFENIEKIAHIENIWYDFSSICEPAVMFQILKYVGVDRCMWGSDFPIALIRGRAVSLGKDFYWIGSDIEDQTPPQWTIGIENLIAVRQAFKMLDYKSDKVEKFFWTTAARLFDLK